MEDKLRNILSRIGESLPTLPATAMEIVRLCNSNDTEIEDLVNSLSLDPSLSVQVLRLANSAKYCRRNEVASIQQACIVLGLRALKIMSLSFSLVKVVANTENSQQFNYHRYWYHSICMAVAARNLARAADLPVQDEAFLCGLIGRVGQLVMANSITEEYDAVVGVSDELPSPQTERQQLGLDHHDVAVQLMTKWELPAAIVDVLSDWSRVDGNEPLLKVVLQVADQIASLISSEEKGTAYVKAQELAAYGLGLSHEELDSLVVALREEIEFLADSLNIRINTRMEYEDLLSEARKQIVEIALRMNDSLQVAKDRETKLRQAAELDALTQIMNRGSFDRTLKERIAARVGVENQRPFSLLMMDVDHFKSFNDTYGHLAGDEVLRCVASWIDNAVRKTDTVARYGGEEFVVVLPTANLEDLGYIAERIRSAVEAGTVDFDGQSLKVTISIGGICLPKISDPDCGDVMIRAADANLYTAKDNGRNNAVVRLMTADPQTPEPHVNSVAKTDAVSSTN